MSAPPQPVDLSNWRESPHNQWSFHNIDKILDTSTIAKSKNPAPPYEETPVDLSTFNLSVNGSSLDFEAYLGACELDGLLVLKDNRIVLERYFRGNSADSKHIMMSMTKSITGLVVGILQEQGKLHVNDLVSKYVPEVADGPYARLTIRQCIDMRAEFRHDDASPAYRAAGGWRPKEASTTPLPSDLHDYLSTFRLPPAASPDDPSPGVLDDRFEYVSLNTDLIGWVIERAASAGAGTPKRLADIFSELIWQPLGTASDALLAQDPAGNARPAGGMCATARDLARVGHLIAADGLGIVPEPWLDDIVHGGDHEAFDRGAWARGFQGGSFDSLAYRSYFLADSASKIVMMLGIFGQMVVVDRRAQLVLVKFSSQAKGSDPLQTRLTLLAFAELRRILAAA